MHNKDVEKTGSVTHKRQAEHASPPRRVIIDNDFAGDPDGLFQLAHHALADGAEIKGVINSSYLYDPDANNTWGHLPEDGVDIAKDLLELCGRGDIPLFQGCLSHYSQVISKRDKSKLAGEVTEDTRSPVTDFILEEAHRPDPRPLYYACGGPLTEIALAYKTDPSIASKLTIVWIGGGEHPTLLAEGAITTPPGTSPCEYNTMIDIEAVRQIVNESKIPVIMVPRTTYRQTLVSFSELQAQVATVGVIGRFLVNTLEKTRNLLVKHMGTPPSTYILGDSPLVLLTSLQSPFEPEPSSCQIRVLPAPLMDEKGVYTGELQRDRLISVVTGIDMRLMYGDFLANLAKC